MPTKSEISFVRSLADKRVRDESGLFVVEGRKLVAEAVASGWAVRRVYGVGDGRGLPRFEEISQRDLERMSSLRTPQGILAVVEMPDRDAFHSQRGDGGVLRADLLPSGATSASEKNRYTDRGHAEINGPTLALDGIQNPGRVPTQDHRVPAESDYSSRRDNTVSDGLTLALDGIQDPGNLGTILRTADWFGIRRVLCSPDCTDRFNPKVVQASMGAIFRIAVSYGELVFPPERRVYGAFLDGENIYTAPLSPDGIIVLGSEGRGISAAAAARVTDRITIPSYSLHAESLNVAAAAAIICSEFRRRGRVRF